MNLFLPLSAYLFEQEVFYIYVVLAHFLYSLLQCTYDVFTWLHMLTCDYMRCYWRNKLLRTEVMFVAYHVSVSMCICGKSELIPLTGRQHDIRSMLHWKFSIGCFRNNRVPLKWDAILAAESYKHSINGIGPCRPSWGELEAVFILAISSQTCCQTNTTFVWTLKTTVTH